MFYHIFVTVAHNEVDMLPRNYLDLTIVFGFLHQIHLAFFCLFPAQTNLCLKKSSLLINGLWGHIIVIVKSLYPYVFRCVIVHWFYLLFGVPCHAPTPLAKAVSSPTQAWGTSNPRTDAGNSLLVVFPIVSAAAVTNYCTTPPVKNTDHVCDSQVVLLGTDCCQAALSFSGRYCHKLP